MEDTVEIPVTYKGKELILNASVLVTGYTHKFTVEVNGQAVIFEPDEERNYRAVIANEGTPVDRVLLGVIAERLKEWFQ
ncbi:MAG: hypothetical protein KGM16_03060 [Bacteroidota bacterium]|nr:hypothetical protein [Bacteroidota bacterium]